ncbi:MAG: hypothetical protein KatS3mg115_1115 [Candidatus Poribacteria bacterium]|nr:MAG: hypothetical protein KatS3mg115_1115 [Candidatus Poribacteria bacterium]
MEARWRQFFNPFKRYRDAVSSPDGPIPLNSACPGVCWRVVRVHPDSPELCRLCEMGLTPGCQLRVVRGGRRDEPIVIEMGESRVCLNAQIAEKVWVQDALSA